MRSKKDSRRRVFLPVFITFVMLLTLIPLNVPVVAIDYYDYIYYEGDDQSNVDSELAAHIDGFDRVEFDSSGSPAGDAKGVTVDVDPDNALTFSWSSVRRVKFIYVREGDEGILFDIGSETSGSIRLDEVYDNDNMLEHNAIIYISFYLCNCPVKTPTPSDPPAATPTPSDPQSTPPPPSDPPAATPTPSDPPAATPTPSDPPAATPPAPSDPPSSTPAPTNPPVATPAPTDSPVVTPTPTDPPAATPTPAIIVEIDDESTPESGLSDPNEEVITEGEESIPAAPAALPKTGGVPATAIYGLGGLVTAAGLMLRRKLK